MSNKAEIPLKLRRRTHLVDRVIKNLLANMYPCYYNSSDHFVAGVLDEIIWFLLDMKELQGIDRNDIENYILDYKYDELTDYFNEHCIVLKNDNLQEHIKKVLKEETYSPAGKEVIPNEIVVHKSNPMFREDILENGLKVKYGECYKIYIGDGIKCKPAIFATNSTNKKAWFDSTYDDDIWLIDITKIPEVKWYKDRHYESSSKHIVTFQNIPKEALTLKYKGTGSGDVKDWDENSPNFVNESIRKVLREETELNKEQFRKIKIVKNFINLSYPHFNKKEIKIERRIMDPLAYEKRFEDIRYEYRDSKTNKYYAIYHEKNNELQLNKEIFKSLKSFLGDEIMEYVIEWFNNEFNKDANSVTF